MSGHISALNETFTSERFAALNANVTAEAELNLPLFFYKRKRVTNGNFAL